MSWKSRLAPVANPILTNVTRPVRQWRLTQALANHRGPLRLNIGAGPKHLEGWLNTDLSWRSPYYMDIVKPWPVAPGSADVVYADNVIEHVRLPQAREVIRNAYAALKPGGVFRLATPDVERVARQYLENGDLARAGLERNREKGRPLVYPVELLGVVYMEEGHYMGFLWDYHSLSTELEAVGFTVKRVDAGQSEHPELKGLEARMIPVEQATALIVEARKPA